MNSLEFVLK